MNSLVINLPSDATRVEMEIDGMLISGPRQLLEQMRGTIETHKEAVKRAQPALKRLCQVMRHTTGQSYKVRSLLYSLWNGRPASLLQVVDLDFALRADLCAVIQAFGYGRGDWEFFYDAIKREVEAAGLWAWFLEAEVQP